MAVIYNDSFTDAADTLLQNHTPELGGTWGQDGRNLGVSLAITNANRVVSQAAGASYTFLGTFMSEPVVYMDFVPLRIGDNFADAPIGIGVYARQDTNYSGYRAQVQYSSQTVSNLSIIRTNGTTATSIASTTVNGAANVVHDYVFVVKDSSQQIVNKDTGVIVLQSTDSQHGYENKQCGVYGTGAGSSTDGYHLDRFVVRNDWPHEYGSFAYPISDVSDGGWTTESATTALAGSIDEAVPSTTDYIQSSLLTTTPDVAEVALGAINPPTTNDDHYVDYTYAKSEAEGDRVDLTVSLMMGPTLIVSWTHTDIGTTPTYVSQKLTTGQANTITDYSNLRLRFSAVKV